MKIIEPFNYLSIGTITKTQGVKGKFCLEFNSNFPEDLEDLNFLLITREGLPVPFAIEEIEFKDEKTAIIQCELIHTREEASLWIGETVMILKEKCQTGQLQLTMEDLIGFEALNEEGNRIGTIVNYLDISGNPILEIENKGQEILIPAHDELVLDIDWENKQISFLLPEGLMDLNQESEKNA
jgi:16S rRNA processing protein RimM